MKLDNFSDIAQVVIIDDKYDEGIPVVNALFAHGIPSILYHGEDYSEIRNKLPAEPLSNCRLIFLDLDFEGVPTGSAKTKAGFPLQFLKAIVGNTSAYILIVWSSKTTDELGKEFLRQLGHKKIGIGKPVCAPIILDKSNCRKRNGDFDLLKIEKNIQNKLKSLPAFNLFVQAEKLAIKGVGEIVSKIVAGKDNELLERMITTLAFASAGKGGSVDRVVNDAFIALNGVFQDAIEKKISDADFPKISLSNQQMDGEDKDTLNSHLIFSADCAIEGSGSIYEYSPNIQELKSLVRATFAQSYNDLTNAFCRNKMVFVYIDVTQLCDSANAGGLRYFIKGIMHPKEFKKASSKKMGVIKINNPQGYTLQKSFEFKGKQGYQLTINLKTYSTDDSFVNQLDSSRRLRSGIVVDIQHKIATYISRPGHIWL